MASASGWFDVLCEPFTGLGVRVRSIADFAGGGSCITVFDDSASEVLSPSAFPVIGPSSMIELDLECRAGVLDLVVCGEAEALSSVHSPSPSPSPSFSSVGPTSSPSPSAKRTVG